MLCLKKSLVLPFLLLGITVMAQQRGPRQRAELPKDPIVEAIVAEGEQRSQLEPLGQEL